MTTREIAKTVIAEGPHAEFPDTILHAQLCVALARKEKRSVPHSLREFARVRRNNVNNVNLRAALDAMGVSSFPEADLSRIKGCLARMESVAVRALRRMA